MVVQAGTALAHIVIATPRRRLELALPEHLPLVSMLHVVLRHAQEDPDTATAPNGWSLRRTDGTVLDLARTLAAQNVHDGEVLHLLPARQTWPEPDFDDVVEAIAIGAQRRGAAWTASETRMTGLISAGVLLAAGLGVVVMSGKPWWIGGTAALATATMLLLIGVVLARALSDSVAGAVVAGLGLPYAMVGGALMVGGFDTPTEMGAPHLLAASAVLLLTSIVGYLGVGDASRGMVAGIVVALYGCAGSAVTFAGFNGVEAAAAVTAAAMLILPTLPLLSVHLVRMPLPTLPRTTADLVKADPLPQRDAIFQATSRADEILTGSILGSMITTAACLVLLSISASVASLLLVGIVSAASLLRARLLLTVRHRIPLLLCGLAGLTSLPLMAAAVAPAAVRVAIILVVLVIVAGIVIAAGMTYSKRPPSPRLGRLGDTLDLILQLAIVPVACSVLGLFSFMRAING